MRASVFAVVLCAACSSRAPSQPTPEPGNEKSERPDMPDRMDASTGNEMEFVAGAALTPGAPLLEWLQAQGKAKRIRIPVVITFANPGRFSIGTAWVGVEAGTPPDDAVKLKLDGTALGVSLVDRVRGKCADKKQMTCVLWLDGKWGSLIESGPLAVGSDDGRHPFAVLAVGDVVDPATATTAFVSAQ